MENNTDDVNKGKRMFDKLYDGSDVSLVKDRKDIIERKVKRMLDSARDSLSTEIIDNDLNINSLYSRLASGEDVVKELAGRVHKSKIANEVRDIIIDIEKKMFNT